MKPTKHGKYAAAHGLYSAESLEDTGIPENLRKVLVDNANASLSYQTWRSVKSVNRRIIECEMQTGVSMELPWGPTQVQTFSAWCLGKNLRDNTIQNYLSKVSHITR